MDNDKCDNYISSAYGGYNVAAVARLLVVLNNNMEKLEEANSKRNELLEKFIKIEEERNNHLNDINNNILGGFLHIGG